MHRTFSTSMLFFLSALMLLGWTAHQADDEIQRIEKDIAALNKRIAQAEQRLVKQKPLLERAYKSLTSAEADSLSVKILSEIKKSHGEAASTGAPSAIAKVRKLVEKRIASESCKEFAAVFSEGLAGNFQEYLEGNLGQDATIEQVVKLSVFDVFEDASFETAFDKVLRPALAQDIEVLVAERKLLERKLEAAKQREAASKAGVPVGMIEIPASRHQLGATDRDLKKMARKCEHKEENVIGLWRATPEFSQKLPTFFIDQNEVTSAWWAEFLKDPENADLAEPQNLPRFWDKETKTFPEGWDNRPVTDITPNSARRFCEWMGRRLPTEFEWEAAARAGRERGELRFWPWGDDYTRGTPVCNNDEAHEHQARRFLRPELPPVIPVGSFPQSSSALGCQDLAGNAFEITSSPYTPYPGFKDIKFNKSRLSHGDFDANKIVIRGGDCLKRDIVVSSVWRFALAPSARATYVGFRTAASAIRGKDHVESFTRDNALRRYLVDIPPISTDTKARRKHGALVIDNPEGYSSLQEGGWDTERNLPCRARHLTVVRRDADCFSNPNLMKDEAGPEGLILGFMKLELPCESPKLDPGMYFIKWRNSYTPAPPEGTEPEGGDKPKKPRKPTRRGKKDEQEAPALPDAIEFVLIGKGKVEPVRLEQFPPVVMGPAQPVRLTPDESNDTVEVRMALPNKFRRGEALILTFNLEFAEGTAARFK